jgi:hypothetical protein
MTTFKLKITELSAGKMFITMSTKNRFCILSAKTSYVDFDVAHAWWGMTSFFTFMQATIQDPITVL